MVAASGQIFEAELPAGFHYRDDFISGDEEAAILDRIARVDFSNFEMRGVVARTEAAEHHHSSSRAAGAGVPLVPSVPHLPAQPCRDNEHGRSAAG